MRASLALFAAAGATALVGCGGSGVDSGGFTNANWNAAQDALGVLARTAVWDAAAKTSYTQGKKPTACVAWRRCRRTGQLAT